MSCHSSNDLSTSLALPPSSEGAWLFLVCGSVGAPYVLSLLFSHYPSKNHKWERSLPQTRSPAQVGSRWAVLDNTVPLGTVPRVSGWRTMEDYQKASEIKEGSPHQCLQPDWSRPQGLQRHADASASHRGHLSRPLEHDVQRVGGLHSPCMEKP